MWWLVVFFCVFAVVVFWPMMREGLEQAPQSSEAIAQLELNNAAIEDLAVKMKELQGASKRIDELDNKIEGTVEMLKSINEQCSKTT